MHVTRQNVGILLFDDVEVLDFAGPFVVFSRTRLVPGAESRRSNESGPFDVFTVGRNHIVNAIGGLKVIPHHSLADAPPIDVAMRQGSDRWDWSAAPAAPGRRRRTRDAHPVRDGARF